MTRSQSVGSVPFIEFILQMILDSCNAHTPQVTPQAKRLVLSLSGAMTKETLMGGVNLKDTKNFPERYLLPAISAGLVEMTQPNTPKSPTQKYRLTKM